MLLSMFLLSVWNALATILLRVSSLLRRQRPFPVFVKNLQGGSLCIRVDGDTTVSHLRRVVEQRSGLGGVGKHVRLWYGTKCLDTVPDRNATVSSLEIHRDSTLEIRGWLCGGGKTRTKGKTAAASTSGAREPSKWVFVVLRQEDGDDIINNSSIKIKNEEDVSDLKERLREDYSGGSNPDFKANHITVYGCDKNTYDSNKPQWKPSTAKNVDINNLTVLDDEERLLLYECFLAVVKTPPAASSSRAISPPTTVQHTGTTSRVTPSSLTEMPSSCKEPGTPWAHPWFVRALSTFYHHQDTPDVQKLMTLAGEVHGLITSTSTDRYGPRAPCSNIATRECTMSGLVTAAISRECVGKNLHWVHQAHVSHTSTADLVVYCKTKGGYLPLAVWEFGAANAAHKKEQVMGYVHNMDHADGRVFPKNTPPLVLAIVLVNMGTDAPTMCVYAVYGTGKTDLGVALLFSGVAKPREIAQVLAAIMYGEEYILEAVAPYNNPWPGGERDSVNVLGSNVVLATVERQPYVYKLYNYLDRPGTHHANRRKPNEAHYPGGELIVKGDDVQLLRYRYTEGKHYASHTEQAAALVQQLIALHAKGLVHGDIRASNVVFAKPYSESRFIDFDFAGRDGEARYPDRFNDTINDGKRHPKAKAGKLIKKEHDWFSLLAILVEHTCRNDGWKSLMWDSADKEELASSIGALNTVLDPPDCLMDLFNEGTPMQGTGSPPRPPHVRLP